MRSAVDFFCNLILLMLFARALLSWFVNPYGYQRPGGLRQIYGVLTRLTEPIVAPCRRLLSRFNSGPIDFSVLVAMLGVMLVRNLLLRLL